MEDFTLYDGRVITKGTLGGRIDSLKNLGSVLGRVCTNLDSYFQKHYTPLWNGLKNI